MLDAYIIEEIKKRDDERRREDESARPRLHIEIPGWPERGTDQESPRDPREPDVDEDGEDTPDVIRIDL